MAGEPDPAFFATERVPAHILTTDEDRVGFKSLGETGYSGQLEAPVFKLFSADALGEELLERLFVEVKASQRLAWHAYPVLVPSPELPPFEITDRVFSVNSFESAASTLQTQATVARSVADLVADRLRSAA